jgi:hypothetical protein
MKESYKKAWKIFKYLFLLFTLIYWVGVIIDDWVFIEKYWETNWLEYIGIWMMYFLLYSLGLSFYYWLIGTIFILINQKIIKPRKDKKLPTTRPKKH